MGRTRLVSTWLRRTGTIAGVALVIVGGSLTVASPALASGTALGWYEYNPLAGRTSACGGEIRIAVGSDGRGMYGKICTYKTASKEAQSVTVLRNASVSSSAAGQAVTSTTGGNGTSSRTDSYTCKAKTIGAGKTWYCAGAVVSFTDFSKTVTAISGAYVYYNKAVGIVPESPMFQL